MSVPILRPSIHSTIAAMNRDELRAQQEPLKQLYRDEPERAIVTLKASGELGAGVSCSVQTGRALVEAGLHPASGGDGLSLCSGDMLLEALAACAGVTMRAVATSLEIPVAGRVLVEGDLPGRVRGSQDQLERAHAVAQEDVGGGCRQRRKHPNGIGRLTA